MVLPQLNLTKIKLEYLDSGFKCKNNDINTGKGFSHYPNSTFFEFSPSLLLNTAVSIFQTIFPLLVLLLYYSYLFLMAKHSFDLNIRYKSI